MKTGDERRRPGKVSLAFAAVLSCLFMLGAVLALDLPDLFISAVMFIAASAVFSFLLIFVRHYAVMAVPIISAAASVLFGVSISLTLTVCCAVTVFAVMYTLCHLKLLPSFRQFTVTALAYSVAGGALFCIILDVVYGSVGGGFIAFGNKIASMAPALADMAVSSGVDHDTALALFTQILGMVHIYIPAMIFSLGIMCAWIMRGIFAMYTRVSRLPSLFKGRQSTAPKAFAVIFLVTSFFGIVFTFLPDGVFYAVSNVRSILSLIFMGEGVRLFITTFSRRAKARAGFTSVLGTVMLLLFFPAMIPIILPYYGALIILFARTDRQENKQ